MLKRVLVYLTVVAATAAPEPFKNARRLNPPASSLGGAPCGRYSALLIRGSLTVLGENRHIPDVQHAWATANRGPEIPPVLYADQ